MSRLTRVFALIVAASAASAASAAPQGTDFGVRLAAGSSPASSVVATGRPAFTQIAPAETRQELSAAVAVASRLGRVTSTTRTAARNRAVGGVRNSFHLSGRAIDVARSAGVRHSDVEAALRSAGLALVESLDEGDHSHFAFGSAPPPASSLRKAAANRPSPTRWRMVLAPAPKAK